MLTVRFTMNLCAVAFPSIMAPLVGLIPNKRRDQMNQFFINSIQRIIKQREEQPPEQVNSVHIHVPLVNDLSVLKRGSTGVFVLRCSFEKQFHNSSACRGVETSFS